MRHVSSALLADRDIVLICQNTRELLRKFQDYTQLHDEDELFFITGSDSALSLPHWYKPRTLARLASFIAVDRPGSAMTEEQCDELAQNGFTVIPIHTATLDISSTEVRRRVSEGRSIRYLCPEPVRTYIADRGLYRKGDK